MCEHACGACDVPDDCAHPDTSVPARGAAGIDRRQLLKRGGLAAAALLLASCGAVASDNLTGTSFSGSLSVNPTDYPQLASTGGAAVIPNTGVAIENDAGTYIALSLVCPHRGGPIQLYSSYFQCPIHGATFDKTGRWIGGQPTGNMRRLTVTVNADGTLTVT